MYNLDLQCALCYRQIAQVLLGYAVPSNAIQKQCNAMIRWEQGVHPKNAFQFYTLIYFKDRCPVKLTCFFSIMTTTCEEQWFEY